MILRSDFAKYHSLPDLRRAYAGIGLPFVHFYPACETMEPGSADNQSNITANHVIFVASICWHSGIAIARTGFSRELIPGVEDFNGAPFFEFRWGYAVFYPADEATIRNTFQAALMPTSPVLLVAPLTSEPVAFSGELETIPLWISHQNLSDLIRIIGDSFDRSGAVLAVSISPGFNSSGQFYPAKGHFHLFNNCNTWGARTLAATGLNVSPAGTITAEDLMRQVRPVSDPTGENSED